MKVKAKTEAKAKAMAKAKAKAKAKEDLQTLLPSRGSDAADWPWSSSEWEWEWEGEGEAPFCLFGGEDKRRREGARGCDTLHQNYSTTYRYLR